MSVTDRNKRRNERRIARMSTWISHAEAISGEEEAHIRFLFYWIAYEAAYQMNETRGSKVEHEKERREFHQRLADHHWVRLQSILRAQENDVVDILELRQAHPSFWRRRKVRKGDKVAETAEAWEWDFRSWVRSAKKDLKKAVRYQKRLNEADWYQRKIAGTLIAETLNDLFENLNVVRNQIVHGGSAGPDSRGRTQVIRGARLMSAFVPCFHDGIKANLKGDWGEPPFPHVGSGPDDECPPPWLT